MEAVSLCIAKRVRHLCFPCVRQQAGNEASVIAWGEEKTSSHGPTESTSRNRAHRRLIPCRLICGFDGICWSPQLFFANVWIFWLKALSL